jgi:hypothetical protein
MEHKYSNDETGYDDKLNTAEDDAIVGNYQRQPLAVMLMRGGDCPTIGDDREVKDSNNERAVKQ